MKTKTKKIVNCTQCQAHKIIGDPDPNDWFCIDDVAVVCTLTTENPNYDAGSIYMATQQNKYRCITVSCRPYNIAKESKVPDWCPKLSPKK